MTASQEEPTGAVIVLITAPSREVGRKIGSHLVQNHLAACANIVGPIESIYTWKGEIQHDEEVLLIVKTRTELVTTQVIPTVKSLHPYEVPEIIAVPLQAGYQPYLDWLEENATPAISP